MSNTWDQKEQKLEAMLQSRRFEPASPDLAERIIRQAQQVPQNALSYETVRRLLKKMRSNPGSTSSGAFRR
jgi:hypothetical protein